MSHRYTNKRKRWTGIICVAILLTLFAHQFYAQPEAGEALTAAPFRPLLPQKTPTTAIASTASHLAQLASLLPTATVKETTYILLLGIDRSHGQIGRTDAIIIAAFNHTKKEIGIISIPRDVWVTPDGLDPRRINSVVRVAERQLGEGKGIATLKTVIQDNLGIAIDYTVAADFSGFVNIIDFLDGIPVNVECPIEDCFHTDTADGGCELLSLEKGNHFLDGSTALKFVRSRHGRTDIDRARRQQLVLTGLKNRLTRSAIIPKLPKLWEKLHQYVETDIDFPEALKLGIQVATCNTSALHGLVLRPPVVTPTTLPGGKMVLLLDQTLAKEAVNNLFDAPLPGKRKRKNTCPAKDVGRHWQKGHQPADTDTDTAEDTESASTGMEESDLLTV